MGKRLTRFAKVCLLTAGTFGLGTLGVAAGGGGVHLQTAPISLQDTASLQRGARLFVDYCYGCHSLKYIRYERLVDDLKIPQEVVESQFIFEDKDVFAQMVNAAPAESQKKWFGVMPPDLTLEARLRSPDWIYSYLISFYPDPERPLGVNNKVFENVGMPHVMANYQADHTEEQFHQAMADVTNFLTWASDPTKLKRENIGRWVLIFLAILFIPVYFLNKEYWKDVK